ncbi:Guanine nucleotide exchange factor VAV3 [Takifugu flavidus]|uniref:Guanine nucleotide exchange factor VAV3 n=1 Tax=Takifugu flavidus TaxID=433684 RepID=A0A5C6NWB4_9TELE|nr:Guanine nucleotide exchange factor VAV3 [Takifugu flavidus]
MLTPSESGATCRAGAPPPAERHGPEANSWSLVVDTLSKLSHTAIAQQTGIRPFPSEESVEDEDIYNHLEDLIDEKVVEDEEDLYDCVYDEEDGGEIYEDLMKTEALPPPVSSFPPSLLCPAPFQKQAETDIRSCCLTEIKQTEEKYTETLESIEKHFMSPLTSYLSVAEIESVFVNIPELVKVHKCLLVEVQDSLHHRSAQNLYQIFLNFKERLLIYGKYCSHVETAIGTLDELCKDREDIRMKLEECSKRANYGKFTLRDLLVVPMQRVLKYHLLLQELVKHTHDATDKGNLRLALDAMKDLAQYVNEVKRDNETLREIDQYQKSIENLNQALSNYGRPKGDGEVRVASVDKRAKQDRHIFLFDAAVIVCKRRGDNYEMKEVIDLHLFKITNNPTSDKETRKVGHVPAPRPRHPHSPTTTPPHPDHDHDTPTARPRHPRTPTRPRHPHSPTTTPPQPDHDTTTTPPQPTTTPPQPDHDTLTARPRHPRSPTTTRPRHPPPPDHDTPTARPRHPRSPTTTHHDTLTARPRHPRSPTTTRPRHPHTRPTNTTTTPSHPTTTRPRHPQPDHDTPPA